MPAFEIQVFSPLMTMWAPSRRAVVCIAFRSEPAPASEIANAAIDAPVATLTVRLSDVAPNGSVALVSAGVLSLTHRRSHAAPEALIPGEVVEVRVPLRTAGYRWAPGHRVRVAVSSQLWPVLWPSPEPATLQVHRGPAMPSRLELPLVPPMDGPGDAPPSRRMPATTGSPRQCRR